MPHLNLAGVKPYFEDLPVGVYLATIAEGEENLVSQNTGKDMVRYKFAVLAPAEFESRTTQTWITVEDTTMWRHRQMLESVAGQLGLTEEDLENPDGVDVPADQLVGYEVCIVVTEQMNKTTGKKENRLSSVHPPEEYEELLARFQRRKK